MGTKVRTIVLNVPQFLKKINNFIHTITEPFLDGIVLGPLIVRKGTIPFTARHKLWRTKSESAGLAIL